MKTKQSQSLAGVIRERLASIEARLAVGVRQEVIVAELTAEGYETTLKNLRNELCRARKRSSKTLPAPPVGLGKGSTANMPSRAGKEATSHARTEAKGIATPRAEKPPENPLKKPTGFNYGGTKDISEDDLI
ncbi:hypothetical protein [Comamonas testosteroni]|uniref:hypothetical protein n=1 Tax=Comamonas testosteroni TaxID=285 RepID=UPI002E16654A|nr:hypothetical protein U0024_26845 [Comamonas testosteroni]